MKAWFATFALAFLAAFVLPAAEVEIIDLTADGDLVWSNSSPTNFYHVEWAHSLTSSWNRSWFPLENIISTGIIASVKVPLFYRVIFDPVLDIEWVSIGQPGNQHDATGYGAVSYPFYISKYEINNAQYVDFLNNVDPGGTNALGLYSPDFTGSRSGILLDTSRVAGAKYLVKTNMTSCPVSSISFWSAARFCNWLHNGRGTNSTESGAYDFNGKINPTNSIVSRTPGASYFIPSENEWFKAAYHSSSSTNYFTYPTGNNVAPQKAQNNTNGAITNLTANIANYDLGIKWNGLNGYLIEVGALGTNSLSSFGVSDMAGNVSEWTDSLLNTTSRVVRGGSWLSFASELQKGTRLGYPPSTAIDSHGFRIARPYP